MAKYIDREKTLSTLENTAKYYEMPNADEWTKGIHYGLVHGVDNIVDNVPIADVVEREKLKQALEEARRLRITVLMDNGRYESDEVLGLVEEIIGLFEKI